MIGVHRSCSGRLWVELGSLAVGFGPRRLVERVRWLGRMRYVWVAR